MSKPFVRQYHRRNGPPPIGPNETGAYAIPHPDGRQFKVYQLRHALRGTVVQFVVDGFNDDGPLAGANALVLALRKEAAPGIPLFYSDEMLAEPFRRVGAAFVQAKPAGADAVLERAQAEDAALEARAEAKVNQTKAEVDDAPAKKKRAKKVAAAASRVSTPTAAPQE